MTGDDRPTGAFPARISRRDLLTAAIGVAFGGVAGASGTAALRSHTDDTARRAPAPGEELMTEHGVLKRLLLAYRAAANRLTDPATPPPAGAILDAAGIIADYIESFHEGLEEAYIFPRIRTDNRYTDLVTTLLVQHDRGRHLTAAITAATTTGLTTTHARTTVRGYLTQFVDMYEPHEAWEDTIIYPAFRAATPQHTLDELADRFAAYQAGQYSDDALTVILDRVTGIEQQLGIADLNTFTPDQPT